MIKYWELLSTSVSVKEASCGTVCAGVRRCCLYNKFSGALIGIRRGRGALIGDRAIISEKKHVLPGALFGDGSLIQVFTVTSTNCPKLLSVGMGSPSLFREGSSVLML